MNKVLKMLAGLLVVFSLLLGMMATAEEPYFGEDYQEEYDTEDEDYGYQDEDYEDEDYGYEDEGYEDEDYEYEEEEYEEEEGYGDEDYGYEEEEYEDEDQDEEYEYVEEVEEEEGQKGKRGGKSRTTHAKPSWNTKNTLIGSWMMTENRKKHDDVIQFSVQIISIDDNGTVTLDWGDSGRITGTWDESRQTLCVHGNQIYVLHDGVLGGANEKYSGVALREGEDQGLFSSNIIGSWKMTEYRKDVNNDIIQFDIKVISVDNDGNAIIEWGSSNRILGEWDANNNTLTVFNQQVYILNNGVLGGGNEKYSGIAFRKAY